MANEIFPNSSRSPANVNLGVPVTLTWNATATLGIAYREGKITKPDGSIVNLARVWYPDGPLGPQSFTDTTQVGIYTWLSRYADMSIIGGAANGLTAEYFNGTDPTNIANRVFTRTDPNINYDFPANTPPSPGIVSDHYSMRWTGTITPRFSENYTFSTISDDGVRLFINGIKIIDNWTDHGPTLDTAAPVFLQANVPVSIELRFFNNFGPGVIYFRWQSFSQNLEVVPQSQLRNTGNGQLTYGTGYKDQTLTFSVGGISQAVVTISPSSQTVAIGAVVNFTAAGGSGTGLFNWGGQASGVGTTKQVTFSQLGVFQVTVYRASDSTYNQSLTAISTITVVKANQAALVASPPSQSASVGNVVTLTANGGSGTGQYVWSGAVSTTTTQNFIQFQVPVSGLSQISCKKLGDSSFNDSNTVTFNVTGVKLNQATVTISPTPINVEPGTTVTFTASGGSGTGAFQWGGDGSGTGTTKQVTFNTAGSRTVTVKRLGDSAYNDSNVATALVTVQVHTITPNSSRNFASRPVGQAFILTWNATATIGLAYREGQITAPNSSVIPLARVNSFEPGMLGPQSFLPFNGKGVYTWLSRYADNSINSGPPFTNGTGYAEQTLTLTVTGLAQATVAISPTTLSVLLGAQVTFTASGGSGSGAYEWGGDGSGTGTTKQVTFNTVGSRTVTVKRLGDSQFDDSNTATATITVTKLSQSIVSIFPSSKNVEPGTEIEFTASGGDGTGDYQWGGEASGTGTTKTILFAVGGTKFVTVKKLGDSSYLDSNTATATIVVATHIITPLSQVTPTFAAFGTVITLKWNATATLDLAYREGSVTKPDGNVIPLARVLSSSPGMLGPQLFTDTAQRGEYVWTSRYADNSINSPPLTFGTGYIDQNLTFVIAGLVQAALSISPTIINTFVGNTVTLTAVGGSGVGQYKWSILFDVTGETDITITDGPVLTIPNIALGVDKIKVKKLSDFTYGESNETIQATVNIIKNPQPTVTIAPVAQTVEIGSFVTFTAIGGAGTGVYRWTGGGVTGETRTVQFNQLGTFLIGVFKDTDAFFQQSNTAISTIVVIPIGAPVVSISASPTDGPAPFSTTITWTSTAAVSVDVSGPGVSSSDFNGSVVVNDLKTGIYTWRISATNLGGTTLSTVQATVDLQPIVTEGFTVHFTDQTVLRADSWLWDFGDGSSTTVVRNPVHTYADIGTYLVTLTVTCDGKTDIKSKLITIGCATSDPLPFTPDWETLVNEETYPPFDDPRYVGTDFESPLGPSASRQSGPANPNWTICNNIDFCDGPNNLDVPQDTRFGRRWTVHLDKIDGKFRVQFGQVGLPLIDAPEDMFPVGMPEFTEVSFITMAFNGQSAPYFAYQTGDNKVAVHFRVNGAPLRVVFFGEGPKLFGEVVINPIAELCDVVLHYVKNGKIYVRFQRENFVVEHLLAQPTIYGEELAVLTKVDANRNEQRIYLYGKTIGGKRLLFRSGEYPAFPDPDPIHYDAPPEFGTSAITLASGTYAVAQEVDFTDFEISISSIDHKKSSESAAAQLTIGDGAYDRSSHSALGELTIVDGAYDQGDRAGKFVFEVHIDVGTHAPSVDVGKTDVTIVDGSTAENADFGSNAVQIRDGTHAGNAETIPLVMTIRNGTHVPGQHGATLYPTLAAVLHLKGSEAIRHRETLQTVLHLSGTHAVRNRVTLSQVKHLDGEDTIIARSTISSGSTREGQHRVSNRLTLVSLVSRRSAEGGIIASTIASGIMVKSPQADFAMMSDTFTGGEYAFGLLTWDNTDDEHFDTTKFTFDLNVSPTDPEIPP
jgi:PKD repeat protein